MERPTRMELFLANYLAVFAAYGFYHSRFVGNRPCQMQIAGGDPDRASVIPVPCAGITGPGELKTLDTERSPVEKEFHRIAIGKNGNRYYLTLFAGRLSQSVQR